MDQNRSPWPPSYSTTSVNGDLGGPELSFDAELSASGDWRLVPRLQIGAKLHSAAPTLNVG